MTNESLENLYKAKALLDHDPKFSSPVPSKIQESQACSLVTIAEELFRLNETLYILVNR